MQKRWKTILITMKWLFVGLKKAKKYIYIYMYVFEQHIFSCSDFGTDIMSILHIQCMITAGVPVI